MKPRCLPALALAALLAAHLGGCAPDPNPDVVREVEALAGPNPSPSVSTEDNASAPSDGPYAYNVAISFSEAASRKLMDTDERVTIAGLYFGLPTPEARGRADETGQIPLGEDIVDIAPLGGEARMPGAGFVSSRLKDVQGGKPHLLINVYSSRLKHPDNLLDCGLFEGLVEEAQAKTPTIHCKLITGEPAGG